MTYQEGGGPAAPAAAAEADEAARGPRDDFYCWTFQIWYPSEDCVFRHQNRTYSQCAGCFQGRMNARYRERGLAVPVVLTPEARRAG